MVSLVGIVMADNYKLQASLTAEKLSKLCAARHKLNKANKAESKRQDATTKAGTATTRGNWSDSDGSNEPPAHRGHSYRRRNRHSPNQRKRRGL